MPDLITNVFGYTPDPVYATIDKAALVVVKGDIVMLRHDSALAGPGLNRLLVPTNSSETNPRVYGVAMTDAVAADDTVLVCLRGIVQAQVFETTTITESAPMLVCSVWDTTGGVPDDALTSAADVDIAAAGDGSAKLIGVYLESAAATGSDIATVMFDGLSGFGAAEAPIA